MPSARPHIMDNRDNIFEFIGGRLRVGYFSDKDHIIICTHGFLKSTPQTPKSEQKTARRAKKAYYDSKEKQTLQFIEEE